MKPALLVVFTLLTLSLFAQERRGNFYLSGNTQASYRDVSGGGELLERSEGFRGQSFRSGYFVTNRLLVGTSVDYTDHGVRGSDPFAQTTGLKLQPFVRYYFLDLGAKPIALFGELGFGTFGEGYETDFHLGLGAELPIAPGVLATAGLNYNANASGINFTNLNLGLNVLTGQLGDSPTTPTLAAGTFTMVGQVGNVAYGRNTTGGLSEAEWRINLTPRVGYFVADGLLLEGRVDYRLNDYTSEKPGASFFGQGYRSSQLEAGVNARYYPLRRGTLAPFAELGLGYVSLSDELQEFRQQQTGLYTWQVGGGVSYFLSSHVAVDLAGSYGRGVSEIEDLTGSSDGGQLLRQWGGAVNVRFLLPK